MKKIGWMVLVASGLLLACSSEPEVEETATDTNKLVSARFLGKVRRFVLEAQTDVLGVLSAESTTKDDGSLTAEVSATVSTRNRVDPENCISEKFGPFCAVQTCGHRTTPPTFVSEPVSAGRIGLRGGLQRVRLDPEADSTYTTKSFSSPLWRPGDMLTWTLEGELKAGPPLVFVPPLAQRQQAPIPITLSATPSTEVDRTKDYSLSWTYTAPPGGPRGAQVGLFIFAFQTPDGFNPAIAKCEIPVEEGHVDIPAAALAKLPPGDSGLAIQEQNSLTVEKEKQKYIFQMYGKSSFFEVTVK